MLQAEILNRRTLEGTSLVLGLDQSHALKTFRASVGDEEGHKMDCILVGLACGKQIEK